MTYREDMMNYTNAGSQLVGYTPNTANYSSGNPLLETGTAHLFRNLLDRRAGAVDFELLNVAINKCDIGNCWVSKLPNTNADISHDDIIGLTAGLSSYGAPGKDMVRYFIVNEGYETDWILSTSGNFYWDALVKPWHKAYYMIAAGMTPWVGGRVFLASYVIIDALFNKSNTSDKKLLWLMSKTCTGKSKLVDFAFKLWKSRLNKVFGSMKNVFSIYYGPGHLFAKWCNE